MLKRLEDQAVAEVRSTLDELAREGARQMLVATMNAEVVAYVQGYAHVC